MVTETTQCLIHMTEMPGSAACGCDLRKGMPRDTLLFLALLGWPGKWAWLLSVAQIECFGVFSGPTAHLQYTLADLSQD